MCLWLWLLCIRQRKAIHRRVGVSYLNSFGFDAGGRYNVTFTEVKGKRVIFALCTPSEYEFLAPVASLCNLKPIYYPEIVATADVVDDTATFSGIVPSRGLRYPIFSVCQPARRFYRVDGVFANSGRRLDTRKVPCLITDLVWLGIFCTGELVWMFNWTVNRKVRNSLHAYFTSASLLALVYVLIHWLALRHQVRSDSSCPLEKLALVVKTSLVVVLFAMVAMLACGLCVIRIEMPISEVAHCFAVSAMVTVPTLGLQIWENPTDLFHAERIAVVVALRAYFVFHYIRMFANTVESFFDDHKVIGPDELEELAKEFKRFRLHYNYLLWWVVGLMILWTVDELQLSVYWVANFAQNAIFALLLCECGWICRLQSLALVLEAETLESRNGIKWEKMRMEPLPK